MKIDVFTHIIPIKHKESLRKKMSAVDTSFITGKGGHRNEK